MQRVQGLLNITAEETDIVSKPEDPEEVKRIVNAADSETSDEEPIDHENFMDNLMANK